MGVRAPLTMTEPAMATSARPSGLAVTVTAGTARTGGPNDENDRVAGDPLFLRIDHVGIAVPDLAAAIAFYREAFRFVCVHEEVNEDQGVREVMLELEDGGTKLQLLAPLAEDSPIAAFIDRRGPGLQQLACAVTDIDAASQRLRGLGVRLLYDRPRRGTGGSRINFVHPNDTGGVLIELVEIIQP